MNFFEYQDQSRRNTKALVFLFLISVLFTIFAVYLVLFYPLHIYFHGDLQSRLEMLVGETKTSIWQPDLFFYVSLGTLIVIVLGSLYMTYLLSAGGSAVAQLMGGMQIDRKTTDLDEKRLQNVVEEMAIASGLPVPEIYVLEDEKAINAFAAGFTQRDATITVTRGLLKILNRQELQAVIGHEFSHILNGDMKLNLRTTSLLHGILCIALIGNILVRSRGGNDRKTALLIPVGLAFILIGQIGVFFGRLIKSRMSREREYLADASSVQFTRNPDGIVQALKKIGGFPLGSRVKNPHAESISHMFFALGVKSSWNNLMATHPPLSERIRRFDPTFQGEFDSITMASKTTASEDESHLVFQPFKGSQETISPADFIVQTGTSSIRHLEYAGAFLESLPLDLVNAAHDSVSVQAVIFNLLIRSPSDCENQQYDFLKKTIPEDLFEEFIRMRPSVQNLDRSAKMPLLDLCIPSLKRLKLAEFKTFALHIKNLVDFEPKISMFEFILIKMVLSCLSSLEGKSARVPIRYRSVAPILPECGIVFSEMARSGHDSPEEKKASFLEGMKSLTTNPEKYFVDQGTNIVELHRALDHLRLAAPLLKQEILDAACRAASRDQKITVEEGELIRALSAVLDCPIPPILPKPNA